MTDSPNLPPRPPGRPTALREGNYQVTVTGGAWMCLLCGCIVDYLDGRDIHDRWHAEQPRITLNAAAIGGALQARADRG